MNLATATLVFMVFITVEQLSGSFFREKRGSCPMYKVMSVSSLCEHEEAQCDTDFICDGDLKCCEDERCGVSKCTKPVIEVEKPVRSLELCPVEGTAYNGFGCRHIETKFCFIRNCGRCCTHKTNCNPARGVLLPHNECRMADPRPSIKFDKNSASSGETLTIQCQPKHSNSVVQWVKVGKGKLLTIPSSMMSRRKLHLVLELRNATIGDSGNYTCRVVHQGKTYYREVTVTVKRSDNQNICSLPFQEGLCNGNITRYYYDVKDDSCKTFQFLGCKGNDNNFASKAQCERRCRGTKLQCPSSGIPKHRNCPPNQHHDCHNDKGCGYRKTCCLVGCTKRCIDPSKPFTFLVTTKSIASTGQPTMTASPVPCGNFLCKHFAECKTNASGFKECVCPKACSFAAIQPICGKDVPTGRKVTYPSMCFLKIRSCRLQRSIVPVRLARCANFNRKATIPKDPCKVKQCSPHATCVINRFNGQAQCLCPRFCTFLPKRVCGSDSRTYHNECLLRVTSCKRNLYVKIRHHGPCNRL